MYVPELTLSSDLVGVEAFKRCKPSVRVVNVARGGIVDEEALLDALTSGKCQGAALDVFVSEPPVEGSVSWRLVRHPRVICTPHLGASTVEAQERVAREIAEQLIDLVQVPLQVNSSPTFDSTRVFAGSPSGWHCERPEPGALHDRAQQAVDATGAGTRSFGQSTGRGLHGSPAQYRNVRRAHLLRYDRRTWTRFKVLSNSFLKAKEQRT